MNTLEARQRLLGRNVYKRTTEGNPAIAQGSLARRYPGITMQGWTKQNGTPTPETPVPIVSAGTQNQETGKWEYQVKLTGANLFDPEKLTGGRIVEYNGVQCYKYIDGSTNFTYKDDFLENTQYCFSVRILRLEENENKKTRIKIYYTDGTTMGRTMSHNELASIVSHDNKTIDKICGDYNNSVVCYIDLSITTLSIGIEPTSYQPYKEQTVTLTSDRQLTKWDRLEKRSGVWGWVYKSNIVEDISTLIPDNTVIYGQSGGRYFSIEKRSLGDVMFNYDATKAISEAGVNPTLKAVRYQLGISLDSFVISVSDDDTIETAKERMHYKTLYEVISETFVPLSESEQEQMNALHTFRPTTVLSNDAGCNMTLTYKTKKSMGGG